MACTAPGLDLPDEQCSANYYCSGGAARKSGSSPGSIGVCERGYYCPEGSPDQIPCERGEYSASNPAASCAPCTEGYYCPGSIDSQDVENIYALNPAILLTLKISSVRKFWQNMVRDYTNGIITVDEHSFRQNPRSWFSKMTSQLAQTENITRLELFALFALFSDDFQVYNI